MVENLGRTILSSRVKTTKWERNIQPASMIHISYPSTTKQKIEKKRKDKTRTSAIFDLHKTSI